MAAGIQFTNYVPQFLAGVNSPSPTLAAEVVTGLPIPTGAFPGNCFFLTEQQANQLSPANGPTLHAAWYMVVKVDAAAVAANIALGAIGAQLSIPTTNAAANAAIPPQAVVTDVTKALNIAINPVVFLGPVTPGNYTIVLVAGDGLVLIAANTSVTLGAQLISNNSTATSTPSAGFSNAAVGLAEAALVAPAGALTLTAAATSSGGTAVYTGTITGGAANAFAGFTFTIAGFVTAANNGTWIATASTATTLTLKNTAAVAETHAGTATAGPQLVRASISFPFGTV